MRRTWIPTALFALTLAAGAAPLRAAEGTGAALDRALAAFKAGEYESTLEVAGAVPRSAADFPRARYLIGETQLLLHDFVAAETAFTTVLELRPEAVPAMVGLARALSAQVQLEEAELHLLAALEVEPDDVAAQRALGELWMAGGRLKEAAELLEGVYARDAKDPRNARALVELRLRMEDTDEAAELAGSLVAARPKHPMGHFLRALVLERQGDDDAAIQAYQAALERDERFLDAHKNLAILCHTLSDTYKIQERNDLALKHYERYFALGGRDQQLERTYQTLKTFLSQASPAPGE